MRNICSTRRVLYGGILFFSTLIFILYMDILPEHEDEGVKDVIRSPRELEKEEGEAAVSFSQPGKKKVYLPPEEHTDLPIIVWWTPFTPFSRKEQKCSRGSCLFTQSRTELTNSKTNVSAFMYYGTDVHKEDLPLPRQPHHLWVLLHEESPKNNWILATEKGISLFNLTATFSRYSDYPLHLHFLHTLDHILQPIRTPTHLKSKGGLAPVMYMQSGCNPPSDRESYVKELMKYIPVDSYGRCLHNKDLPDNLINTLTFDSNDVLNLAGKYKFVLSFENALCHDYFTEKYWRPFYSGSVPIVRGSPTIKDWDPSATHPSIIVTDDFKDPKALAEYLMYLNSNDTAYEKYLEYKKVGVTNKRLLDDFHTREWGVDEVTGLNFVDGFECFVCDKLHERREKEKEQRRQQEEGRNSKENSKHTRHKQDVLIANISHYHCLSPKPSIIRGSQTILERLRELEDGSNSELTHWIWYEKCATHTSRIMSEAISRGADQSQLNKALTDACNF